MAGLRRFAPLIIAAAVALVVGLVAGNALGDDGGSTTKPATTKIVTSGEVPAPCREAIDLAAQGMDAATQVASLAQAAMNARQSGQGPSPAIVQEAAGRVTALRGQLSTLQSACDAAQAHGSTTTSRPGSTTTGS